MKTGLKNKMQICIERDRETKQQYNKLTEEEKMLLIKATNKNFENISREVFS